jgi:hypothetical protein
MADDNDNDDDIVAAAIVTPAQSKEQEEYQGEAAQLLEQLWNGSFPASAWNALSAATTTMEVSAGWREPCGSFFIGSSLLLN